MNEKQDFPVLTVDSPWRGVSDRDPGHIEDFMMDKINQYFSAPYYNIFEWYNVVTKAQFRLVDVIDKKFLVWGRIPLEIVALKEDV